MFNLKGVFFIENRGVQGEDTIFTLICGVKLGLLIVVVAGTADSHGVCYYCYIYEK